MIQQDNRVPQFNPLAAYTQGLQVKQFREDRQRQNALAQFNEQNGAALVNGDPRAINALAGMDPERALQFKQATQPKPQDPAKAIEQLRFFASAIGDVETPEDYQRAEDLLVRSGAITPAQAAEYTFNDLPRLKAMTNEALSLADRYKVVDGRLVDLAGENGPQVTIDKASREEGGFRVATPEEAAQYGAQAGQFGPDGRFFPINPPSGMTIESDGAGGFRLRQGSGVQSKPFTEAQSKTNVYATRARGALETLEPIAGALTSIGERALDADPTGLARGALQTDDYQVAKAAGEEFLQAILRKDTGAAITSQEQTLYGKTYLPQPGDNEAVLRQKAEARRRAINAIEAGMSPAQMLAVERGLDAGGQQSAAQPPQGVEPDLWDAMTPEERALFQ